MASFTRMILPAARAMLIPNSGVSYVRPVSGAIINAYNQQSLITSQPSFQTQTNSILLNSYRSFQTTAVSRDIDSADKFIRAGACTVGRDGSDSPTNLEEARIMIKLLRQNEDKLGKQLRESEKENGRLESKLEYAHQDLIKLDGLRILRTHVELMEGLGKSMCPIPVSANAYREALKKRKQQINVEIEDALDHEINATIDWPKNFDAELKDAMGIKINKHFRIWMWLLYMADTKEIVALRNSTNMDPDKLRMLANGIAGLYIYASVDVHSLKNYSRKDIINFALSEIQMPSVHLAAKTILNHTWMID